MMAENVKRLQEVMDTVGGAEYMLGLLADEGTEATLALRNLARELGDAYVALDAIVDDLNAAEK